MSERSITLAEFGAIYLGGKSAKTAKRRVISDRIPCVKDGGHLLILESDAIAWRESRRKTLPESTLKSRVIEIAERVRAERKKAGMS